MTNVFTDAEVDELVTLAIDTATTKLTPRPVPLFPVYVASKIGHAGLWKDRRRVWRTQGIQITSHWIDQPGLDNEANLTPLFLSGCWIENLHDVLAAKAVLCYVEKPDDTLRGALVEVGIAMGQHRPVIIVGPPDAISWGSWQYHPLVHYCRNLEEALHVLRTWAGREPLS